MKHTSLPKPSKLQALTKPFMVLLLLTFFGLPLAKAQNNIYLNNNGSQNVSHGETISFYDEGGPSSGPDYYWNRWYKPNKDYTFVFNPTGGENLKITFNQYTAYGDNGGYNHAIGNWALRINDDHLYIYDGDEVNDSKLIADLTGSIRDAFSVMTEGPMTIRFVTNSRFNEEGWYATVETASFVPQAPIVMKEVCGTGINLFALPGYDIYYTTNGAAPTTSSTLYDGSPFVINLSANNASVTVKAKAFNHNDATISSELASVNFTHSDDVPTPGVPVIQFSGNTVTMIAPDVPSFLNETYNVYYTTTGDDPYTIDGNGQVVLNSNAIMYSAPFEWTTPNTRFKAFTWAYSCDNKYSSIIYNDFGNVHVPTPTIVFGTTKDTIKCSMADVIITYTTDGTDPVVGTGTANVSPYPASGTPKYYYLTIDHVAAGTTVKARANKKTDGFQVSEIASEIYIPASGNGLHGSIVLLDDREDHSWSYYSDGSQPVHRLNPADVKITYYGYGNNTMTTTDTDDNPTTFNGNVAAADVAVGPNDAGNQFIYLKTLENANEDGSGNYPYTLIPNPFSKRPTRESSSSAPTTRTIYLVTSGNNNGRGTLTVTYTNASGQNATETVSINSNSFSNTRPITAKVGGTITYSLQRTAGTVRSGAYYDTSDGTEIWYVTRNSNGTSTPTNPYTVQAGAASDTKYRGFYAWRVKRLNGVTIQRANGTPVGVGGIINAEEPIEFVTANAKGNEVDFEALWAQAYVVTSNTITGLHAGVSYERNFVVGASVNTNAGLEIPVTYSAYNPDGTSAGTASVNGFTCKADTKFEYMTISGGTFTAANHDLIMGRGLTGTASMIQGINGGASGLDYMLRVESGTYTEMAFVRSSSCNVSGRYLVKSIMGCDYDRAKKDNSKLSVSRDRQFFFSTGVTFGSDNKDLKTFDCVFKSGSYQSDYWGNNVTDNGDYQHSAYLGQNSAGNTYPGMRYVTIEGGEFGSICGGRGVGGESTSYASPGVVTFDLRIKGGLLHGCVYGAAADNPSIGSRRIVITGGEIRSWVAAGCNGTGSTNGTGATNGDSYVYVGGDAVIGGEHASVINGTAGGQVFGAGRGYQGRAGSINSSNVVIADNANISNPGTTGVVGGNVYGGGYNSYIVNTSKVYILGGTVQRNVFGGSYGNGTAIPTVNVYVKGGTVIGTVYGGSNSSGTVNNTNITMSGGTTTNVFGGGYGVSTIINGGTSVTVSAGTVSSNVYGGGALGRVTSGNTNVTISGGTMNNVFGAGQGDANNTALISGNTTVNINGGVVNGTVYGGGELGKTNGTATVNIMHGELRGDVFGGALGTQETVFVGGMRTVNVTGGHIYGNLYGGSKNANDALDLNITHNSFDGSNETRTVCATNISGGQLDRNVYAAGYFGRSFGSVYVFIGESAINSAPNHVASSVSHTPANLRIAGSVWAGGDWGTFSGTFGAPTITGYSNIYVDGTGYDVSSNDASGSNYMNIGESLLGCGTSCDAGRTKRFIIIRNYGIANSGRDFTEPFINASRTLYSIQRTDYLVLDNAHINFAGQNIINSMEETEKYSIHEIKEAFYLANGGSIFLNAPATQMKKFVSASCTNVYTNTTNAGPNSYTPITINTLSGTPNKIRVNGGNYIKVYYNGATPGPFGELSGFAYMMASTNSQENTCAYARPKQCQDTPIDNNYDNSSDGGFVSYDSTNNKFDINGYSHSVTGYTLGATVQMAYENHVLNGKNGESFFRIWRNGGIDSYREGILNAVSKTTDGFSTVDATITLPPFHANGVYYRIEVEDGRPAIDYGADILTFNAARANGTGDDWMYYNIATSNQVTGLAQTNANLTNAIDGIKDNSDVNYGLIIMPTMGFATGSQNYILCYDSDPLLVANSSTFNKGNDEEPQVTFRLTYYNQLNSNASYDPIRVVLVQCDATGKPLDRVTIALGVNTITTIEQTFSTEVYAIMQGNGISDAQYTAKLVLPTFNIYNAVNKAVFKVNSVSFTPANEHETDPTNYGNLQPRSTSFDHNKFAVTLKASDNTDHTNGWYTINENQIDAYPLSQSSPTPVTIGECDGRTMIALDFILHYNGLETVNYKKGLMGTLTFNIVFSNYKNSSGVLVNDQPIRIDVKVYRRGLGGAFYLDGQNGKNTNDGLSPDNAAYVLSTILNRLGYMPGDKIYVVNTVETNNNLVWSGSKYGNITLYRYPGGHTLNDPSTGIIGNSENTAFTGSLINVTKNMTITDIILDGHGSAHGSDAAVIAQSPLITIENGATLDLNNGTILKDNNNGNTTLYGGAVNISNGGTLMMNYDATITGNVSSNGGGVFVNGDLIVSKDVTIYDNHPSTGSTGQNNVFLNGPELVVQIGTSNTTDTYNALTTNAKIGVTKALEGGEAGYVKVTHVESEGDAGWLEPPYIRPNAIIVHDGGLYQLEKYNDPTFLYWLDTWVSAQNTQPSNWGASLDEALANINTPEKLAWIISLVNGENGQTANDFTGKTINITADLNMGAHTWDPIGNGNTNRPFRGAIQGNGHVIEGVNSSLVRNNLGLFGVADGATIQNLIVKANFSGDANNIGTLVGSMNRGTISNCEAAGTHRGSSTTQNMGGLVGITKQGTIHSSFAINTMEGGSNTVMGGLVGTNGDGTNACDLLNSYSNVIMTGSSIWGGLVGINKANCKVENCYAEIGSQSFPAFATSNAGTIQYCYANQANSYVTTNTGTMTGHGIYGTVKDRKDLGYMYDDNLVTLAAGGSTSYVPSTSAANTYVDNHIVVWRGLLSALNQWVRGHSGYTPWFRPITPNINGDLPVLAFPKDGCMATVGADTRYLYYSDNFDGLLDTYSSQTANIFLYKSVKDVAHVPGANVNVFINEDACLIQADGAGDFINTTVGVTFDNSSKKAGDYFGNTLTYDWHLLSSALTAAPMGITYTYDNIGYNNDADFKSMTNNYLPNTTDTKNWDLYTYYEPEYHWVNLKRSSDNHWHYDEPHEKITYTNETTFTPGKGYMVAISQDSYLNNKGTLNKGDLPSITLTCSGTEQGDPSKDWGSNLIGNPYQAYLDLNAVAGVNTDYTTFYIYDAETGIYAPFTQGASPNSWTPSRYIHPHQAFFVIATPDTKEDFNINYNMATTSQDGESYFRGQVNYPLINLFVENENGNRDYTIIEVGRPELGGAEKNDVLRNTNFNLYARYEQKDYKLLFTPAEARRVAVFFKADEDGTYTLTWDTQNGKFDFLRLIDNITGTEFDMLSHDHYTFEGHATDFAARFYVLFNNPNEEDPGDTGENPMAYNDGHGWIVNGSGQLELIDVAGHVLYSKYLSGDMNRVHFDQFATGVYVLKLNDKTQKIVIK